MNAENLPVRDYRESNKDLLGKFDRYFEMRGLSLETRRSYALPLERRAESLGAQNLLELERFQIRKLFSEWEAKGLHPNSMRLYTSAFRAFFKWCRLAELIKYDPTLFIEQRKLPSRKPVVLTIQEVRRLIAAASDPFERAVVEVLYATGARVSEFVNLRLEDISLGDPSPLRIHRGKGGKDRVVMRLRTGGEDGGGKGCGDAAGTEKTTEAGERTMRAAIYCRVSTANGQQSTDMQSRELREYCGRRGWTIADEYIDAGVSGSKDRRPSLDRLISDAKRRKFDAVIVYRYDRFARSLRHLVNALEEFRALGIEFVSLHEGVDTSTPNGRLVFGIFASVAEFERELIRDRVRSGLRNARAKGQRLGRPTVVVDVAKIATLRGQGLGWRAVAAKLGTSERTIRRLADARQNPRH